MSPKFSIVMPLFNKSTEVRRAIDSVLGQTLVDFELLVVDDGSTDGGAEIVRAVPDQRIRLIRQDNSGVSAARNAGIRLAEGDIVAFLDSDDEWKSGFLQTVLELSREFPEAGWFSTGYRKTFGDFAVESSVRGPKPSRSRFVIGNYFHLAAQHPVVTASNVAIRKSLFDRVGGFPPGVRLGEDQDLWARLAMAAPIAYDRAILAIYHSQPDAGPGRKRNRELLATPHIGLIMNLLGNKDRSLSAQQRGEMALYVERKLLQLVSLNIKAGCFDRAKAFLNDEYFDSDRKGWPVVWYRVGLDWFPKPLMRLAEKAKGSKQMLGWHRFLVGKSFSIKVVGG